MIQITAFNDHHDELLGWLHPAQDSTPACEEGRLSLVTLRAYLALNDMIL